MRWSTKNTLAISSEQPATIRGGSRIWTLWVRVWGSITSYLIDRARYLLICTWFCDFYHIKVPSQSYWCSDEIITHTLRLPLATTCCNKSLKWTVQTSNHIILSKRALLVLLGSVQFHLLHKKKAASLTPWTFRNICPWSILTRK